MSSKQAVDPKSPRCFGQCLLLALAYMCSITPAAGESTLTSTPADSGMEMRLVWPDPLTVDAESSDRELILRFSRPLGDVPLTELVTTYPDLLENVRYGFDSMLLRAKRAVTFTVETLQRGVVVRVIPLPTPAEEPQQADAEKADHRLELLRALTLIQEGEFEPARMLLRQLHARSPEDIDVVASLASTEAQLGNWREADRLYEQGLAARPESAELRAARDQLRRQHGTSVQHDTNYVDYHDSRWAVFNRESARVLIDDRWTMLGSVETVYLDAKDIRRISGNERDFSGARVRGQMAGEYDWIDGGATLGTLFANPNSVGAALSHTFGPLAARSSGRIAYHEAEWRYLEGVVNQGTRDQVAVGHRRQIIPRLQGGLGAALNRYGVRSDDEVARSVEIDANLSYTIRQASPLVTFGYFLDAEYSHQDKERNAAGERFSPLPVESREIHSLELAGSGELTEKLSYTAGAGLMVERIEEKVGPLVALTLRYQVTRAIGIDLRFRHALTSAQGEGQDGQYTEAGLSLVWTDL